MMMIMSRPGGRIFLGPYAPGVDIIGKYGRLDGGMNIYTSTGIDVFIIRPWRWAMTAAATGDWTGDLTGDGKRQAPPR